VGFSTRHLGRVPEGFLKRSTARKRGCGAAGKLRRGNQQGGHFVEDPRRVGSLAVRVTGLSGNVLSPNLETILRLKGSQKKSEGRAFPSLEKRR